MPFKEISFRVHWKVIAEFLFKLLTVYGRNESYNLSLISHVLKMWLMPREKIVAFVMVNVFEDERKIYRELLDSIQINCNTCLTKITVIKK